MPAGNLAFSPEFEKVKTDLRSARDHVTAPVEAYSQLIGVVGQKPDHLPGAFTAPCQQ